MVNEIGKEGTRAEKNLKTQIKINIYIYSKKKERKTLY